MSLIKNAYTNDNGDLILTPPPSAPATVLCTRCSGTGLFRNTAKCYTCAGKGHLSPADIQRNATYAKYNRKNAPAPTYLPVAKSRLIHGAILHRTPKENVFLCNDTLSSLLAALDPNRPNRLTAPADLELLQSIIDDFEDLLKGQVSLAKGNSSDHYYLKVL